MFRQKYVKKVMIFVTGITFLNMSFFLAEVAALKLTKNKAMMENIARLISGAGFEEERDICGETSEDSFSEVDLHNHHHGFNQHNALYLIAQRRGDLWNDQFSSSGYRETFSPPPEG